MKEEIRNSNNKSKFKPYIKQCCLNVWSVEEFQTVKTQEL